MSIVDRINNNLSAVYNIDDPIYQSLICKQSTEEDLSVFGTAVFGTSTFTTLKPIRNNIGAIASELEYLREAGLYFLEQIYVDTANREFLKYQLEGFFNSYQLEDETEAEWIQRTFVTVFQQKCSNAAIKYALNPYSSQMPDINTIVTESAFADFSYADVYVTDEVIYGGETVFVFPAIAESLSSSQFTIRIILYDTASEDIFTVQSIINNIITAGIVYVLEIHYT